MINSINLQNYQTKNAQNFSTRGVLITTKNTQSATNAQYTARNRPEYKALTDDTFYVSPDYDLNEPKVATGYDTNITGGDKLESFSNRVYTQSQSIDGKVSQRRYKMAVNSLVAKMQEFMQTLPQNSLAYEWADRLYEHFLDTQSPYVMGYDEIDAYTIRLNGTMELANARVQESKDKFINALQTDAKNTGEELAKLQETILGYSAHLTQMPVAAQQFFSTFESAFGDNEMQAIINDIATIMAYGEYNAHNIKLSDGSTISWERDARGVMSIFINGEAIETYLENTKLLKDTENFATLLEMLDKKRDANDEGVDISEKLSEADFSEEAENVSEKLRAIHENLDNLSTMLVSNSKADFSEILSFNASSNSALQMNLGAKSSDILQENLLGALLQSV